MQITTNTTPLTKIINELQKQSDLFSQSILDFIYNECDIFCKYVIKENLFFKKYTENTFKFFLNKLYYAFYYYDSTIDFSFDKRNQKFVVKYSYIDEEFSDYPVFSVYLFEINKIDMENDEIMPHIKNDWDKIVEYIKNKFSPSNNPFTIIY